MRDDEHGVLLHQPVQGLLNHRFAVRIQGTCCLTPSSQAQTRYQLQLHKASQTRPHLIQKKHRRTPHQGACYC